MRWSKNANSLPVNQQGLALLILMVILVFAFVTYTVSGLSLSEIKEQHDIKTRQALGKAKAALISYAVNFPEITATNRGPGYLPCPDLNDDGVSETSCNGPATVGRFPYVTLGTGDLRDSANERLWYAVSENFDYTSSPANKTINTSTEGSITLRDKDNNIRYDGSTRNALVAIVIAPGKALTRQDGIVQNRASGLNSAVNYLDVLLGEEDNKAFVQGTVDGFIEGEIKNAAGNIIVNDRIVAISYNDIMKLIHARVAAELKISLTVYLNNCGSYPEATIFNPEKNKSSGDYISDVGIVKGHIAVDSTDWTSGCAAGALPVWFEAEQWHKETYYHHAVSAPGCATNCLTDVASGLNNIDALVVFAGRQLPSQVRGVAGSALSDYFEGENNNGDLFYDSSLADDYIGIIAP